MIAQNEKDLISRLESIYPKKYTYEKVIYVDDKLPVTINCKKHGDFYISPYRLLVDKIGCPKCYEYLSNGEKQVKEILEEYGIAFEQEKNLPYLEYKKPLYFDFYIPYYSVAIEFQGPQHFRPIEFFGGKEAYNEQVQRDNIKREWCRLNEVELIEINFYQEILPQLQPLLERVVYD